MSAKAERGPLDKLTHAAGRKVLASVNAQETLWLMINLAQYRGDLMWDDDGSDGEVLVDQFMNQFERYFDVKTGNWKLPECPYPISELAQLAPGMFVAWAETELGTFQDMADVWLAVEKRGMNSHAWKHVERVLGNIKILDEDFDDEGDMALTVAAVLHDSGISIAGRASHEKTGVAVAGQLLPGWSGQDPFCARVAYLIENHCTAGVNLDELRGDRELAKLILADEADLGQRFTPEGEVEQRLKTDAFGRAAKMVQDSEIGRNGNRLRWEIITVGDVAMGDFYEQLDLVGNSIVNDLNEVMFGKPRKREMYQACVQALLGNEGEMVVVIDGEEYLMGVEGLERVGRESIMQQK